MIGGFQTIGKIPELKRRILVTFALLAVYRVGVHVPTPGINSEALQAFFSQAQAPVLFDSLQSRGQGDVLLDSCPWQQGCVLEDVGTFNRICSNVDFPAVLEALKEIGYEGWIVVEQDVLPGLGTPKESAQRNRDYLRGIGL